MEKVWDDRPTSNPVTAAKMNTQSALFLVFTTMLAIAGPTASDASPCAFESLGDGRVAEVVDARSFRLSDGREIKLAGVELATATGNPSNGLAELIDGREVVLYGSDDAPDRYGRQSAFVSVAGSDVLVQRELLARGQALLATDIADRDCAAALAAAESEARADKRGIWADAIVIKSAESPDDILSRVGRFTVVEGKVLSVRQAGATTYLNFARNWTRGFAVTISGRALPVFESAGLAVKSLEQRRIRVRGWVEAHSGPNSGPRIDAARVTQIEVLNGN